MNDATSPDSSDEQAQLPTVGHYGIRSFGVLPASESQATDASLSSTYAGVVTADIVPALSGVQGSIAAFMDTLDGAYHHLVELEQGLQLREAAAREQEMRAAQAAVDAHRQVDEARQAGNRQAEAIVQEAHQRAAAIIAETKVQAAQIIAAGEAESRKLLDRSRMMDLQVAQRLAELGRRDQELREREVAFAQQQQQQLAEREWLNQYAQTLAGIAADLEQAVGDLDSSAAA